MNQKRPWGLARVVAWATGVALTLGVASAAAQSVGEAVRIETAQGVVEGTLLDKLPNGYLVRVGDKTDVIPYASVKSIAAAPPAAAPPAQEPPAPAEAPPGATPQPEAEPASPPEVSPTPPPPASPPPPPHRGPSSPGLVVGGAISVAIGGLGLVTGAVLLPVGLAVSSDKKCHDPSGSMTFDCEYGNTSGMVTAGAVALGAGAALLVGGIIMMVAGGPSKTRQGRSTFPSWQVAAAPQGGGVRWAL